MADIVERLRHWTSGKGLYALRNQRGLATTRQISDDCTEAAKEIETLRTLVVRCGEEAHKTEEELSGEIETLRARIEQGNKWMAENETEHRAEIETLRARDKIWQEAMTMVSENLDTTAGLDLIRKKLLVELRFKGYLT